MIMLCTQAAEEKFLSENPSVVAEYNNKYVKQEETMQYTDMFKTRKDDFAKEQPSVKEEEEHVCEYPQTRNNKFTSLDEKKIDITLLEDSQQDTCGSQNVNRQEQSKFHSLTKNKFFPAVRLEIPSFRPSIKPNNGTTYYVSNSSTTQHSAEQIDRSNEERILLNFIDVAMSALLSRNFFSALSPNNNYRNNDRILPDYQFYGLLSRQQTEDIRHVILIPSVVVDMVANPQD